ncbi:MAG: ankyrin repeat domain-containing protein [Planctomycetota bacterium]
MTHELVDVPSTDPDVFSLLYTGEATDRIKASVVRANRHVDEIRSMGQPLLSVAVSEGRIRLVEWLIDQGADVNGVDDEMPPLSTAIARENQDMVVLLLNRGADLDHQRERGVTPRQFASAYASPEMLRLLGTQQPTTPTSGELSQPE